jgi:hypothetical protein
VNNFQYSRGNLVYADDNGKAMYCDGVFFDDTRPCVACGISVESDGPDPCLGLLDGVDAACCGHGVPGEEYVVANGIRYESVEEWREAVG